MQQLNEIHPKLLICAHLTNISSQRSPTNQPRPHELQAVPAANVSLVIQTPSSSSSPHAQYRHPDPKTLTTSRPSRPSPSQPNLNMKESQLLREANSDLLATCSSLKCRMPAQACALVPALNGLYCIYLCTCTATSLETTAAT